MNNEHGRLADLADEQEAWPQPTTKRAVRWKCIYCWHEVPEEHSPHCGEVGHTEAMSEDDDD